MKSAQHYGILAASLLTGGAAHASGIPQMDHTWYANQLLWLALSFVLLYVLVSGMIAPTIRAILVKRADAIETAIIEAKKAQRTAESTRGSSESAMQNARVKASELILTAQTQASRDTAEAVAKLEHELNRKSEQAYARIQDAVVKAEGQMEAAVADLATTIADKLLSATSAGDEKLRKKA